MRHIKFSSIGKKLDYRKLYKTNRTIKYIVVHCTASKTVSLIGAKAVDKMHLARWGSKSGCGYHYIVLSGGDLQKGRWADFPGAHVYGYNAYSIGVAYVGGLDSNGIAVDDILPDRQRQVLINTIKELKKLYPDAIVLGHKEFPRANKACPCMDMDRFKREVDGRLF